MLRRCEFLKDIDVRYDDQQKVIIIGSYLLTFRPSEYKVLYLLLLQEKVQDSLFIQALYQREINVADKRVLKKLVYNIRSRLKPHNLTISRIAQYGYILQHTE